MTGEELDEGTRAELRTLPKDLAARVARHLVMAGRLVDEDPELAYRHAKAARRVASRVGVVREATGFAAYHAGEWAEALAELRAARRLPGREGAYLPVMADCERGLGRPERALDLARSPEAAKLDQEERVELRIVESGARRDLGQYAAAVVTLQIPELKDKRLRPWSARLFYAYADALVDAERDEEAREWFARAAAADRDGETDAAERYAELEGLEIIDTEDDEDQAAGLELASAEADKADEAAEADDSEQADDQEQADDGEQAERLELTSGEADDEELPDSRPESDVEDEAGPEDDQAEGEAVPEVTFSAPQDVRPTTATARSVVPEISFTPPPARPETHSEEDQ